MADKERLTLFDRLTTLWILLAMALGVGLGALVPGLSGWLDSISWSGISIPLAIGLIWMMYPPLARVQYRELPRLAKNRRLMGVSLFQNWVLGPFLMFALAWIFLPDLPEYRVGLIPATIEELTANGHEAMVETRAGEGAGISDDPTTHGRPAPPR